MRDRPSLTALAVCWMRATERRRRDAVVDDPHALGFLPPPWRVTVPIGARLPRGGLAAFVVLRHRFIDRHLAGSPTPQTVLLGAGYDSRPWRLDLATRWLEVDHPATLRRREARAGALAPTDRTAAPIDFRHDRLDAVLDAAGHDPTVPTSWVWEGVSMYLGRDEVAHTLEVVRRRSAPGSQLLLDLWHRVDGGRLRDGVRRALPVAMEAIAEPLRFGLHPADATDWLRARGWRIERLAGAGDLSQDAPRTVRPDPSLFAVRAIPFVA